MTDSSAGSTPPFGIVVIGRNEGQRLVRCIHSLRGQSSAPIVYVDSGSTDGSVPFVESVGVACLQLDMSTPFTMGRARNAGFRELTRLHPGLSYVQFVDGDCEIDDGWLESALGLLEDRPELVAVCGHLRERHPDASLYNRLFDIECRGPFGAIDACGGVAMYRAPVFAREGGFDETMIAGEEPELCVRLRRAQGVIWRSRKPMALHDADMHTFAQWWTRAVRSGHAYADGLYLQGFSKERHNLRPVASALVYGLMLPTSAGLGVAYGLLVPGKSLIATGAALVLVGASLKIAFGTQRYRRRLGDPFGDAALYGCACVVAKVPEAIGVLRYARNRLAKRRSQLIEYRARRT